MLCVSCLSTQTNVHKCCMGLFVQNLHNSYSRVNHCVPVELREEKHFLFIKNVNNTEKFRDML